MEKIRGKDVYRSLRRTYRSLRLEFNMIMENNGLTWVQFHALYHINEEGIPVSYLSKHLNCNTSNLTGLIDRMVEKKIVIREQSPEDRRVWLVKLTAKGIDFKNRLLPKYNDRIEDRIGVLNKEEMEILFKLLEKLRNG